MEGSMITIRHILAQKGDRILDIPASATLTEAAQEMSRHGVGALAVRADGAIIGLLSERDLVLRLAKDGTRTATEPISDVMQPTVDIDIDEDLNTGLGLMTNRRRRHLLVRDGGAVVGMVSIGDLVKATLEEQAGTISSLHQYITG
jgi:CBS domain-containing protein